MRLGPEHAALRVRTRREGAAARVGHDLLLEFTRWQASAGESVALEVDPRSIAIVEGPSGEADRRRILDNVETRVLGTAPITFASTSVQRTGDRLQVSGRLTIAGATRPFSFEVDIAVPCARVTLRQSDWGIRPFSALMGALRVRDEVVVELLPWHSGV